MLKPLQNNILEGEKIIIFELEAVAYFPGTFHEYEILVDGPGE